MQYFPLLSSFIWGADRKKKYFFVILSTQKCSFTSPPSGVSLELTQVKRSNVKSFYKAYFSGRKQFQWKLFTITFISSRQKGWIYRTCKLLELPNKLLCMIHRVHIIKTLQRISSFSPVVQCLFTRTTQCWANGILTSPCKVWITGYFTHSGSPSLSLTDLSPYVWPHPWRGPSVCQKMTIELRHKHHKKR